MSENCESCKFWATYKVGRSGKYDCRRFPPLKYFPGEGWSYPQTASYDWCGEWKKKVE